MFSVLSQLAIKNSNRFNFAYSKLLKYLSAIGVPIVVGGLILSDIIIYSFNYLLSSGVLSQFQNKPRVIPFGIDLARFALSSEKAKEVATLRRTYGPSILLFIGRFRYYKGLHVLIRAMTKVSGKLLLIGAGPLEKDLRKVGGRC